MKIKFLGAAGTVTGSSYVLTSGSGTSILIDLGMFQGPEEIDRLNYLPYDYDCAKLVGAVLTHAHLDHCGRLPIAFSHGYTGKVWMTPPTRDLTELSLFDSAKIAKEDQKEILYDKLLVEKTVKNFLTVNYRTPTRIGDFMVTMLDAGHILGSASLIIEDLKPEGEIKKVVFSGDLGNSPAQLLRDIDVPEEADMVVMESTYGDKLHPTGNAKADLAREINEVESNGGTLLIPAFSLDRTQEILHLIMQLKREKKVRSGTVVFLDSPMALKATAIYQKYRNFFSTQIQTEMQNGNPFEFEELVNIVNPKMNRLIKDDKQTKVIIAGSGMMNGGKIVKHALNYLPQKSTRLFIVGYQGEQTLGRDLLEGINPVEIHGETIPVRANINHTESMSSHADQKQLMGWLAHIKGVKKVVLTHGEDPSRQVMAEKISQELVGVDEVLLPGLGQEKSF